MDAARIADLLQPFLGDQALSRDALNQTSIYIDLLLRWNARINLTAIRDPESMVTRHFGESFFLARHLFPNPTPRSGSPARPNLRGPALPHADAASTEAKVEDISNRADAPRDDARAPKVIDIGSGAGFPGLPLKIWAPNIPLTLIEANHKKAAFLREVVRALTLMDVNVIAERAETLASRPEHRFEVVTLRAVERFDDVLPIAAQFVAPAGRLALLIGSAQMPSASTPLPSFSWDQPVPIPLSRSRILVVGRAGT
jgi:16S rRNA (guanine527-N7)-methyltransferase